MSTLYLARVVEQQPVADAAGQRVVVECVTVHPDAGLPPHATEGSDAERRFVLRLIIDGDAAGDDEDPELSLTRQVAVDEDGFARSAVLDLGFDDGFWREHCTRWWAVAEVVPGVPVREWLAEPSDSCPYQVATFEAVLRPGVLRRPRPDVYGSTAYW
ncbi:hypothetical protein AB0B66_32335 [Catellatospora sp. NPDC049111]|uniref:hypothetical protein n=1 Tax=Catellatospora sp. NPDC049111 TaxID=3155271 RepID=UPI0033E509A5